MLKKWLEKSLENRSTQKKKENNLLPGLTQKMHKID